jgi:hypothetical protein
MSMPPTFKRAVKRIVEMLVAGDYRGLERVSRGVRLTAAHFEEGVREYGRTLVMPPDPVFERLDVVEVKNVTPRRWGVRVDLWTVEEGRSDLTLEVTLVEQYGEEPLVEVDDLHVL